MRPDHSSSTSSGWEWNAPGPSTPQRPVQRPPTPRGGSAEAVLAGAVFLGVLALGVAAYFVVTSDDDDDSDATADASGRVVDDDSDAVDASKAAAASAAAEALTSAAVASKKAGVVPSLDEIAWTTDVPATLEELSGAWTVPLDVLRRLNPELASGGEIEAGAEVIVHTAALGQSMSIGPPNDGRLIGGVPLPQGPAWRLPPDRGRAFATTETIAAVTAALVAYGRRFPESDPVQVGELSARRGGNIYGHQSHQTGRDVDIRLIANAAGDGFDAEHTWFLVKTLIDDSDVRDIFLNRTEQPWLRAAAEADVGAALAEEYFAFISHEPGHTIHMHIRFGCPEADKRCVGYSMSDKEAPPPKGKLPLKPGSTPRAGPSKLPGAKPKGGAVPAKASKGKKKGKKLKKLTK